MGKKNQAEAPAGKKRKAFRILILVLMIVFAAAFGVSLYMLLDYYGNAHDEQSIINDLKKYAASAAEEGGDAVNATLPEGEGGGSGAVKGGTSGYSGEDGKEFVSQYAAFHDVNPDYIGWLYMEGTKIDYPVMYKPEDPEYYSRRTIYGADSRGGIASIFTAIICPADCSSER